MSDEIWNIGITMETICGTETAGDWMDLACKLAWKDGKNTWRLIKGDNCPNLQI